MAGADDIRRVRVDAELWDAYAQVVGDLGRAKDLRDYIEWRIDHPSTPLPGKRRGPIKRVRPNTDRATASESASVTVVNPSDS